MRYRFSGKAHYTDTATGERVGIPWEGILCHEDEPTCQTTEQAFDWLLSNLFMSQWGSGLDPHYVESQCTAHLTLADAETGETETRELFYQPEAAS